MNVHPIVLCGGSGTRLWPRSRQSRPKPFLPLFGKQTLFEATLLRCSSGGFEAPMVVTGSSHLPHVLEQTADLPDAQVIVEPEARNTAPAIAQAAALLPDDAIMLVCPSDHHIANNEAFLEAANRAVELASKDWMVSFGITPTSPETGYGYILRGPEIEGGFQVDRFVEKPDYETALRFLADGRYSWNGGIFAFRVGAFLEELTQHRPAMAAAVKEAVAGGTADGRLFHPLGGPIAGLKGESVDYAIMELTPHAAVVPVDMGWSDIGNWLALRDARPGDANGNRVNGRAEFIDCNNVLVESDGPRVSVIGLHDVAIVVDGDEVLVTNLSHAQKVGKLKGATSQ